MPRCRGDRSARTLPPLPSRASLALRNWPVSRRLVAVIVMAVVMGLVFGGLRVASAIGTASSFGRTTQLAVLGEQVTALAQAMETERDMSAAVLADNRVIAAATAAKEPDAVLKGLKRARRPTWPRRRAPRRRPTRRRRGH